jgi:pimeloyl-ACP methyl ester carboxylesterase
VPLPRRSFVLTLATSAASAASAAALPSTFTRAALAAPPPPPAPQDLEVLDFQVEGDKALGRRFVLLAPKHLAKNEKVPLLVLLHGLGETVEERMGAYAWLERYGLGTAYDRLRRPPVKRTSKRPDWTNARVAEVNAELAARPFRGMVIACPFTPNVQKAPNRAAALDGYTKWLAEVVIPRARKESPALTGVESTWLDGCSLGGYIGIEVFLRRPDLFGAWGGVQSAIMPYRAEAYASQIAAIAAKAAPRKLRIHLETSIADPFREGNELLSSLLTKKGVPNDLLVLPGPHDQPWLRESGTLEMLLWHSRASAAPP